MNTPQDDKELFGKKSQAKKYSGLIIAGGIIATAVLIIFLIELAKYIRDKKAESK
jgi:hypothetical protein